MASDFEQYISYDEESNKQNNYILFVDDLKKGNLNG